MSRTSEKKISEILRVACREILPCSDPLSKDAPRRVGRRRRSTDGPTTHRSDTVKFMLLIHNRPGFVEELTEAERTELFGDVTTLMTELTASGELIGTEALADPVNTRTVRVRDGVPVVTDGPFVEAKEHFAGYLLLECDSLDRAIDIAARWPDAKRWAMEVRPVMTGSGTEM